MGLDMTTSNHKTVFLAYHKRTIKRALSVATEVAGDLAESLVIRTPVDTSRAEANWETALNTVPQDFDEARRNLGGSRANLERAKKLAAQMRLGDVFVMANSTPYIFRLENGWSKQAPAGFRDITAALFSRMVERAAKRAKGRP